MLPGRSRIKPFTSSGRGIRPVGAKSIITIGFDVNVKIFQRIFTYICKNHIHNNIIVIIILTPRQYFTMELNVKNVFGCDFHNLIIRMLSKLTRIVSSKIFKLPFFKINHLGRVLITNIIRHGNNDFPDRHKFIGWSIDRNSVQRVVWIDPVCGRQFESSACPGIPVLASNSQNVIIIWEKTGAIIKISFISVGCYSAPYMPHFNQRFFKFWLCLRIGFLYYN